MGRATLREEEPDVAAVPEREEIDAVGLVAQEAACADVEALLVGFHGLAHERMHHQRDALGLADLFDARNRQHGRPHLTPSPPQRALLSNVAEAATVSERGAE